MSSKACGALAKGESSRPDLSSIGGRKKTLDAVLPGFLAQKISPNLVTDHLLRETLDFTANLGLLTGNLNSPTASQAQDKMSLIFSKIENLQALVAPKPVWKRWQDSSKQIQDQATSLAKELSELSPTVGELSAEKLALSQATQSLPAAKAKLERELDYIQALISYFQELSLDQISDEVRTSIQLEILPELFRVSFDLNALNTFLGATIAGLPLKVQNNQGNIDSLNRITKVALPMLLSSNPSLPQILNPSLRALDPESLVVRSGAVGRQPRVGDMVVFQINGDTHTGNITKLKGAWAAVQDRKVAYDVSFADIYFANPGLAHFGYSLGEVVYAMDELVGREFVVTGFSSTGRVSLRIQGRGPRLYDMDVRKLVPQGRSLVEFPVGKKVLSNGLPSIVVGGNSETGKIAIEGVNEEGKKSIHVVSVDDESLGWEEPTDLNRGQRVGDVTYFQIGKSFAQGKIVGFSKNGKVFFKCQKEYEVSKYYGVLPENVFSVRDSLSGVSAGQKIYYDQKPATVVSIHTAAKNVLVRLSDSPDNFAEVSIDDNRLGLTHQGVSSDGHFVGQKVFIRRHGGFQEVKILGLSQNGHVTFQELLSGDTPSSVGSVPPGSIVAQKESFRGISIGQKIFYESVSQTVVGFDPLSEQVLLRSPRRQGTSWVTHVPISDLNLGYSPEPWHFGIQPRPLELVVSNRAEEMVVLESHQDGTVTVKDKKTHAILKKPAKDLSFALPGIEHNGRVVGEIVWLDGAWVKIFGLFNDGSLMVSKYNAVDNSWKASDSVHVSANPTFLKQGNYHGISLG
ncbi:MAG: hypothetical protein K2X47_15495, partial [Bdellovibrionales bacterium]|nr:hypothetical protein [Bdellovibrionales bacterium]